MAKLTVGELKKLLEKVDDNIPVIMRSDNFELHGSSVDIHGIHLFKMKKVEKEFIDAFDYGHYFSEIYEYDENGQEVLTFY